MIDEIHSRKNINMVEESFLRVFFTISFIDVVEVNKKKIYLCQMRKNGKKYIENVK